MTGVNTYNFTDAATGKSVDAKYVTDGTAKAWGQADGTGTTLADSLNVSSIDDNGTGDIDFNYSTALADTNHAVSGWSGYKDTASVEICTMSGIYAGYCRLYNTNASGSLRDPGDYSFITVGDLA
jgi:hypothetical protein